MDFIPYKVNEYLENTFYQVPKELFTNPYYKKLNSDSILLYALLLDRLSVSRKNEWIDEDGNVFLLFARKDVEKKLKLSDKTVTKAFKLLAEHKLIYEKRLGFRKKNIIYVDNPKTYLELKNQFENHNQVADYFLSNTNVLFNKINDM